MIVQIYLSPVSLMLINIMFILFYYWPTYLRVITPWPCGARPTNLTSSELVNRSYNNFLEGVS